MDIEEPKRETEISRVVGNLRKAVEALAQCVSNVEMRLGGVMNKKDVVRVDESLKPPTYFTKLAQDINESHDKVQGLRNRLEELLDRVEL